MPSSEVALIQAQIARMKALIVALEAECSTSDEQRERFLALKRELDTMKERVAPLDTHPLRPTGE